MTIRDEGSAGGGGAWRAAGDEGAAVSGGARRAGGYEGVAVRRTDAGVSGGRRPRSGCHQHHCGEQLNTPKTEMREMLGTRKQTKTRHKSNCYTRTHRSVAEPELKVMKFRKIGKLMVGGNKETQPMTDAQVFGWVP